MGTSPDAKTGFSEVLNLASLKDRNESASARTRSWVVGRAESARRPEPAIPSPVQDDLT